MTDEEIEAGLVATIQDLQWAINRVKREFPDDPYRAQYHTGEYILLSALSAEATAMSALAVLRSRP